MAVSALLLQLATAVAVAPAAYQTWLAATCATSPFVLARGATRPAASPPQLRRHLRIGPLRMGVDGQMEPLRVGEGSGAFGSEDTTIQSGSAFLVAVDIKRDRYKTLVGDMSQGALWTVDDSLDELARLCETAGLEVAGRDFQSLPNPSPSTFIGAGKLDEIAEVVKQLQARPRPRPRLPRTSPHSHPSAPPPPLAPCTPASPPTNRSTHPHLPHTHPPTNPSKPLRQQPPSPITPSANNPPPALPANASDAQIETVVFDDELSPAQQRNVQERLGVQARARRPLLLHARHLHTHSPTIHTWIFTPDPSTPGLHLPIHTSPCTNPHANLPMHTFPCTDPHAQLFIHTCPFTGGRPDDAHSADLCAARSHARGQAAGAAAAASRAASRTRALAAPSRRTQPHPRNKIAPQQPRLSPRE